MGLAVLRSSSGSMGLLLPGDFCTLCSLTWSYEYLFFPRVGVFLVFWGFFPLFNLKYKLLKHIAQALSHGRCKTTVKMQRKERQ